MEIASALPVAFGVGFATGLRSMTGPAAVAWGARLGWLKLAGTGLAFLETTAGVAIFSLAALGEYVGDKLPKTPSRKAPGPFGGRVAFGGLCGWAVALGTGTGPAAPILMGVLGTVAGTLGGYEARVRTPPKLKIPDWPYALAEDLFALGLALFLVSRLAP